MFILLIMSPLGRCAAEGMGHPPERVEEPRMTADERGLGPFLCHRRESALIRGPSRFSEAK